MHENREISGASRSNQDRDRSAKAQNHNADMYVSEKSDCAVLPMNQPNKGESSPAEVGEGGAVRLLRDVHDRIVALSRDASEISRFSCMLFLSVPGFLDYAGPAGYSRSNAASRVASQPVPRWRSNRLEGGTG